MQARKPNLEVYRDSAGEWRWSLKAANGEPLAQGEGHPTKAGAERAAETAARNMAEATADEADDE